MKKFDTEIVVGIFILAGILCMGYTSIKLGQVDIFNKGSYYPIKATFSSVTGLKEDTNVEISGVKVGTVADIRLEDYQAIVTLYILKNVKIQEDAIASIRTKGLLGERYVAIIPGASDEVIEPGGTLFDTEPPFELEGALKHLAMDE